MLDRVGKKESNKISRPENRKRSNNSYLTRMYQQIYQEKWFIRIVEVLEASLEPLGVPLVERIV